MRAAFAEMGVLHFEDNPDSTFDEGLTVPPALLAMFGNLEAPVTA